MSSRSLLPCEIPKNTPICSRNGKEMVEWSQSQCQPPTRLSLGDISWCPYILVSPKFQPYLTRMLPAAFFTRRFQDDQVSPLTHCSSLGPSFSAG